MTEKTALLFFTRTSASEAAHKTFVHSKSTASNFLIASLFIKNARTVATSSRLPVFEINEKQQLGEGFGERLANAIENVFAEGFENVIVIGNDCPRLTNALLTSAADALKTQKVVLGPDQHGGVYLIGINKTFFNKDTFECSSWQTNHLFEDLVINFGNTETCVLPILKDVNQFNDLLQLTNVLPKNSRIKAIVVSIIASSVKNYTYLADPYHNLLFHQSGLRAPPLHFA